VTHLLNNIPLPPDWPGENFWFHWLFFSLLIVLLVIVLVIVVMYIERRVIAFMQARLGPNRAGPFGLLQPIADAVKVLIKEDIIPDNADKLVYWVAPVIAFFPVLLVFAVIPFQNGAMLTDLNIGIFYVLAISSISIIGIFMAGWASNNKYSMISAMRSVAAIVSYEIPVVLSVVGVVIVTGSMSMNQIVLAQNVPFILTQPLGFLLFFIAGCAEISRSPFDLLEADQEIVAGHHTDYSGMKFAMFYLVEFAEAAVLSALIATVFLGGWKGPLLPPWLWFLVKTIFVYVLLIWTRATLPRVRIDQLMALAWKFLLPLSIINILVTGIEVLFWPDAAPWLIIIVNFAITALLILIWSKLFKLGWGRIETGTIRDRYC
jgi:NADH-quinone oxidoreductase subunit H